ncbi:MAG: hypothetical protein IJ662_10275 [Clostridia bacterium]|nr:hypothetical protein [Clostridia bacterium]
MINAGYLIEETQNATDVTDDLTDEVIEFNESVDALNDAIAGDTEGFDQRAIHNKIRQVTDVVPSEAHYSQRIGIDITVGVDSVTFEHGGHGGDIGTEDAFDIGLDDTLQDVDLTGLDLAALYEKLYDALNDYEWSGASAADFWKNVLGPIVSGISSTIS